MEIKFQTIAERSATTVIPAQLMRVSRELAALILRFWIAATTYSTARTTIHALRILVWQAAASTLQSMAAVIQRMNVMTTISVPQTHVTTTNADTRQLQIAA